jgi:autotransporter-associated beta strand protein
MDGGSLTVNNGNWIRFGADGGTGNLTMAKTGTIAPTVVASGFALVGHNGNGTIDMSAGSFTCNSMMEVADGNATSSLTMTGDSTLTTHKFNVGNHPGSNGTVDISGGAVFNNTIPDGNGFVDEIQIGISGTGVMKVHGGTALVHPVVTNSGSMRVGHADNAPGGTATLELSGYAQFIQQGADMWAVSVGTTGATGTMTVADHATYTHDGGNFWLSWDRGQGGTTKGILNLQGGVFESRNILTNGGTGTINWQGGVYRMATGGDLNPFQTIFDGGTQIHNIGLGANGFGAIIDTTNQEVNTNVALMHDPLVTTGLDGGLTKIGPNTLTLTGALAYTGNTNVNQGTLVVNNLSTPDATVFVATGATLNATSIVADTLTIGGAPVVIGAAATVPEPSTLALLVLAGLAFVGACLRRK